MPTIFFGEKQVAWLALCILYKEL